MKEHILYVPSLNCDSCEKIISKALRNFDDIKEIKFNDDSIKLQFSNEQPNLNLICEKIESLGYRVSDEPIDILTFKEMSNYFKDNKKEFSIEISSLMQGILMFFLLWIVPVLSYFAFFSNTQNFWNSYFWWFFYLNISIAFLGATIRVLLSYKAKITSMTGMMIGMTLGMQTGMMIGAVIGASNGFFVGAMTGMILGVLIGAWVGKCCGVMGVMEGMMAGLMGGTMGPMISTMMIADNVLLFMPFYMIINIIILLGLWYMHYEVSIYKAPKLVRNPIDFPMYASISIVMCTLLTFIMLFGPKNILAIFVS